MINDFSVVRLHLSLSALLLVATGGAFPLLAQPANDALAGATSLTGASNLVFASNIGATKEPGEPNHANDSGGHSVWWRWTAPFTGRVIIDTEGSNFDTLLAVYRGAAVNALSLVAANDDDPLAGEVDTSRLWFNAVAGTNYAIAVDGWSGATGAIQLRLSEPSRPPNDQFTNPTLIVGVSTTNTGTTIDASKELGEPDHAGQPSRRSIWWRWRAPGEGVATVTTAGSDFDTTLAAYTGTNVGALSLVADNDQDPVGSDTSAVTFDTFGGEEFSLAVDAVGNDEGSVVLAVEFIPRPLLIPAPTTNGAGFAFALHGVVGRRYLIETATNLFPAPVTWTPLLTNSNLPSAVWSFTDSPPADQPRRFYRARYVP